MCLVPIYMEATQKIPQEGKLTRVSQVALSPQVAPVVRVARVARVVAARVVHLVLAYLPLFLRVLIALPYLVLLLACQAAVSLLQVLLFRLVALLFQAGRAVVKAVVVTPQRCHP